MGHSGRRKSTGQAQHASEWQHMRHRGRSCFQQTITPSLPLQSSLVWAMMSNVSLEVSPSHTDPYINTRERGKKKKKKQEAAHESCGWAQPVSQQALVTFVWQEVGGKWCITVCAHRNATSSDTHYLDPFLHDHDTLNQSKCWLIKVQTDTFGSIRPSIKHVSSWPLNVHW